jgi:hypothetical protein
VIAGSLALSYSPKIGNGALTAYHVAVSCILFLLLLPRFFPAMPLNLSRLSPNEREDLEEFIALSRLAYIGIFSFAMVLGAVVLILQEKVVRVMDLRGILHTMAAGAAAFVAVVIFNPFHLTNLAHTFVISISKNAEQWRNVQEWHRAFDWTNPVGTAVPFLIMYILAWLVLVAWTIILIRGARSAGRPVSKKMKAMVRYTWPQIDLGLLIIAALTIYMAIRSRRFIPIAGFTACPVIALLVDQAVRFIAGSIQLARTGKFEMPVLPLPQRRVLVIVSAGVVAAFGLVWGTAFKHVYLDPWPLDAKYKSVFMRMTASYSKPFEACEFMRLNKLSGKMYNYWTEGGFIAWGQEPDPETGRIPLQLFMDGRAQAAYDVAMFDLYLGVLSGGPIPSAAARAGRTLTGKDYVQVSSWISEQLRKYGVWVVLMPDLQFDKTFTIALEYSTDWRIVYIDDKQKMFVDVLSPKGMALYQGMFTGKTGYPNDYLAEMAVGHNLLFRDSEQKKKGLEYLVKALKDNPTPAPMVEMLFIGLQSAELRPRIDDVCQQYVEDFEDHKDTYARQDGYNMRLHAARLALARLEQMAKAKNDAQSAQTFRARIDQYKVEIDQLALQKKW